VERTAHGALITATIPREFVVLAQTPQGFRYGLLQRAFAEATADGFVGTDEASLAERAGIPVAVVHGSQVNLKITQPGDLELAEFYLRSEPAEFRGRSEKPRSKTKCAAEIGRIRFQSVRHSPRRGTEPWTHASDLAGTRTHSSPACRCALAA
jgi:hypothetical protein